MPAVNCVICDADEQYAMNLAEYINRKREFHLSAQPFTDPEKLLEYAHRQRVDLLLINANLVNDRIKQEVTTCCVFSEEEADGQYLRKYASAAELVRRALRFTMKINVGQGNILAVYSPVGRCGKTCFALALAGVLARQSPTLYLNLEDYPWVGIPLGQDKTDPAYEEESQAPTLSDLLYRFHTMTGQQSLEEADAQMLASFREELEKCVYPAGGPDMIRPARSSCDLQDISTQEWKRFLHLLSTGTAYDYLVLDIGCQMPDVFQILSMCGHIYMPVLDDIFSRGKITRFDMTLRTLRGSEGTLERRIRRLKLPQIQTDDYDSSRFLKQLLDSPMGAAAESVVRGL